jgi:hypothetical protein
MNLSTLGKASCLLLAVTTAVAAGCSGRPKESSTNDLSSPTGEATGTSEYELRLGRTTHINQGC